MSLAAPTASFNSTWDIVGSQNVYRNYSKSYIYNEIIKLDDVSLGSHVQPHTDIFNFFWRPKVLAYI